MRPRVYPVDSVRYEMKILPPRTDGKAVEVFDCFESNASEESQHVAERLDRTPANLNFGKPARGGTYPT